jgi:hypothetical protein
MYVLYIYMITEVVWWSFWQLLHHVMMVCPKFLVEHTASVFMATESSIQESDPRKSVSECEFAPCCSLQTIAKRVDKSTKNLHAMNPPQMKIRPLWDCHTTWAFLLFIQNTFMCTSMVLSRHRVKMIGLSPRVVFILLCTIKDNLSLNHHAYPLGIWQHVCWADLVLHQDHS